MMLKQRIQRRRDNVSNSTSLDAQRCRVHVDFFEESSVAQVVTEITKLSNPQVVLWYIGPRGLKKTGVEFYRESLISPLFLSNPNATFWLIDLTAWSAFLSTQGSIQNRSSYCELIQKLSHPRIKCISADVVFKKMQAIKDLEIMHYFRDALKRSFIEKSSLNFPKRDILIGDIFHSNCTLMSDWYNYDVANVYSIFQYLEGCLLCEEIWTQEYHKQPTKTVEIAFALPNDELKYYQDSEGSFQKDIKFLMNKRCEEEQIADITLNIKFFAFKYGSEPTHRPYNAPGTVLKQDHLFLEEMVNLHVLS